MTDPLAPLKPAQEQLMKSARLRVLSLDELTALLAQPGDVLPHSDIQYEFSRRQLVAAESLIAAMEAGASSADRSAVVLIRLTKVVIGLTIVLGLLTVALVVLTAVLVARGH